MRPRPHHARPDGRGVRGRRRGGAGPLARARAGAAARGPRRGPGVPGARGNVFLRGGHGRRGRDPDLAMLRFNRPAMSMLPAAGRYRSAGESLSGSLNGSPVVWAFAVAAAATGAWIIAADWIAAAGIVVLCAGWRYLRTADGPPVLAMAFTFQWAQITMGVYYHALTRRSLDTMDLSDYRPMVLIGLGCLVG